MENREGMENITVAPPLLLLRLVYE